MAFRGRFWKCEGSDYTCLMCGISQPKIPINSRLRTHDSFRDMAEPCREVIRSLPMWKTYYGAVSSTCHEEIFVQVEAAVRSGVAATADLGT